jgi:hypothetical protein
MIIHGQFCNFCNIIQRDQAEGGLQGSIMSIPKINDVSRQNIDDPT